MRRQSKPPEQVRDQVFALRVYIAWCEHKHAVYVLRKLRRTSPDLYRDVMREIIREDRGENTAKP